jgi:fimbrial chaperone protein
MRFRHAIACILASAAAFWLPPASAGTFTISPLRVELSAEAATAAVTVRNEEDMPALIQVDTQLWTQASGEERLEATHDVLVSPAVFTLPPKGSQLVRVALRRDPDGARELSYRLILQEVPPEASPEFTGLRVALRLSVPVFVSPAITAKPDLAWSAARNGRGAIVLRADNSGGAHARVLSFTLTPESGQGPVLQDSVATYVLPGQYRTWTLKNNDQTRDDSTGAAARYRLKANTERGEVVTELSVGR